ncbi:MAG: hypothetical protein AABN95_07725 [Acidobacteriota bacterium]
MADEHIATYLNDHLAGSVAALELLEHLEADNSGTPLERFFAELTADISADRQELESLMSRLNVIKSRARRASAWIAEKLTELKLRIDDPAGGNLRLFESLEALSLGIEGKRALWLALAAASEDEPSLKLVDYEHLERRATEQRSRVETMRLEAARKALVPGT